VRGGLSTGRLAIAPVIIFNKTVHGKMTPDKLKKEIKTLKGGEQQQAENSE